MVRNIQSKYTFSFVGEFGDGLVYDMLKIKQMEKKAIANSSRPKNPYKKSGSIINGGHVVMVM
jgi:hypothetical protein